MMSPGLGCRECAFKVSTVLDYNICIATCPRCGTRYAVIQKGHHIGTDEAWYEHNLGNRLEDMK